MEVAKDVIKFMLEYFTSVKEDIFGSTKNSEDDDSFDIESGTYEGTRLMRPETEDITEQEISNSDNEKGKNKTSVDGGQHEMHRPTMQASHLRQCYTNYFFACYMIFLKH